MRRVEQRAQTVAIYLGQPVARPPRRGLPESCPAGHRVRQARVAVLARDLCRRLRQLAPVQLRARTWTTGPATIPPRLARRSPIWPCSGRGLASRRVTTPLVGSYPTISPLPAPQRVALPGRRALTHRSLAHSVTDRS